LRVHSDTLLAHIDVSYDTSEVRNICGRSLGGLAPNLEKTPEESTLPSVVA